MADARALVAAGAPSGVVVLTDFQRAGRGRLPGRQWVSAPSESLMFTIAIAHLPDPQVTPLRAGAAVARSLEAGAGLPAGRSARISTRIRWPNDVLVGGRKIAGILCEYSSPWVYVGIGLNLHQERFPGDLAGSATSVLQALGSRADRDALLLSILEDLGDPGREWRAYVNDRLWMKDERALVTLPDGSRVDGVVREIASDGTLIIERAGVRVRLPAGELSPGSAGEDGA